MKIAVIGAGLFGSTLAIALRKAGYQVELFEKNSEILASASGINQYRLHRGYHYPRSIPTAVSAKSAAPFFENEYGEALIKTADHYYCIAKEESKVLSQQFLNFCETCELEYAKVNLDCINPESVQLTIRADEHIIDPIVLRDIINKKFVAAHVNLHLNTEFTTDRFSDFDYVVNCTYASLNGILENCPDKREQYQFELCEKPVLQLPVAFQNKSIVVIDGPFMCIDPYANTGYHVMGNVVHAIHVSNIGYHPVVPDQFKSLLNKGIIVNPPVTNIGKFIESAAYFMPEIRKAKHIGSMFTFRTVLPNVDATDERPTLVSRVNKKVINVFSGKLGNSVEVAEKVLAIITSN
jgi:hypothetical protein